MLRAVLLAGISLLALNACAPKASSVKAPAKAALSPAKKAEVKKLYLEGAYLYAEGENDKAIGAWKKVLSIDPGHAQARSALKEALAKKKAMEALDKR